MSVLVFLIATLLVASVLITRRGLVAIQAVIDEQLESEEQRKAIELQLRQAQKMDAIGQLTGGIAHDFNNVLGIIIGNIDLLSRRITNDEKARQYLQSIETAAYRAAKLTKQLLGFSRQHATDVMATEVNKVIASVDVVTVLTVSAAIDISQNFAEDLWLTEIDVSDFHDAILNLIINARDAMPYGGFLTIETRNTVLDSAYCSLHAKVIPGDYVHISISDTGMGIPRAQLERVFEPFFTTKAEGEGTGLGLAMVFGFIERSNGHIAVYSELNIGTTFNLYLPRSNQAQEQAPSAAGQSETLTGGKETILVVDDEEGLLELAENFLGALGYQVWTAGDGVQALALLKAEPSIALLFSDVVMPGGLNGYELAEQAVAAKPALKVLLTSGYTKKAIARNGQARFDTNLLNKPYTQAEMAKQIRALLDQP